MSAADRTPLRIEPYSPISDYAFLSDGCCSALVNRAGSIDWCCMPRHDWESCFGRLLDAQRGGHWCVTPIGEGVEVRRRYLDGTLILETTFLQGESEVRLLDGFLLPSEAQIERGGHRCGRLFRVVEGVRGEMRLRVEVVPRFEYGELLPWFREGEDGGIAAVGGDVGLAIYADGGLEREDHGLSGEWTVREGDRRRMLVQYAPSKRLHPHGPEPVELADLDALVDESIAHWRAWSGELDEDVPAEVERSALVIQGLVYRPTGAIVGAATTSLPESMDGPRNWDYRFTWIRDSVFALDSLGQLGFWKEARDFRHFVERAAAGNAAQMHPVYGIAGEFRLVEIELSHLEGYRGRGPVRIGNDAYQQQQHDIYGELIDLAWRAHEEGSFDLREDYLRFLETVADEACRRWEDPDHGIWEVRQAPQHFVHSKVMCWVAVDRACKMLHTASDETRERWGHTAREIREAVEREGYDAERGVFVRTFGSRDLDASLLLLPRVAFVAWDDERMVRTVRAIRDDLCEDGQVLRYRTDDGIPGEEGAFVPCTFWLIEALARQGEVGQAGALYDQTMRCANDLGLFAEQYDAVHRRQLGNFPLGLSHYAHISAALALREAERRTSP